MNILFMIDAEGLGGIFMREQVNSQHPLYAECRRYMTRQLNELAAGFKAAGAGQIFARDCHGGAGSILWDEVSSDVDRVVLGNTGSVRLPHIQEADAVVLMGYHAMAGTPRAVLEHTMSSAGWQKFCINGKESGEILFDASVAGDYGKPVILVTGDDLACAEARACLPGVVTAEVKQAMSCFGASMLSPAQTYALLRTKAAEAVRACPRMKPVIQKKPVTLYLELVERGQLPRPEAKPYMKIVGNRAYEVTGDTMDEAFCRL